MEDRELLELAAKAAGIQATYLYGPTFGISECMVFDDWTLWNPLGDDGDALRLAAKLNISIDINGIFVHADCRHCKDDIGYFEENTARNDGCIMKAIRRAIVRAAAGIGSDIP